MVPLIVASVCVLGLALTPWVAGGARAESPTTDGNNGEVVASGTTVAGDARVPQVMPLTGDPILANESALLAANIVVLVFLLGGVIWQLSRERPL